MHLGEGLHDGLQYGEGLGIGELAALGLQIGLEAHAVHIFHDEVGGVVLLEIILYRYDVWGILKLRQDPGLVQKPLHAISVILLRQAAEGNAVPVRVTGGNGGRHIFLDGHPDL